MMPVVVLWYDFLVNVLANFAKTELHYKDLISYRVQALSPLSLEEVVEGAGE